MSNSNALTETSRRVVVRQLAPVRQICTSFEIRRNGPGDIWIARNAFCRESLMGVPIISKEDLDRVAAEMNMSIEAYREVKKTMRNNIAQMANRLNLDTEDRGEKSADMGARLEREVPAIYELSTLMIPDSSCAASCFGCY